MLPWSYVFLVLKFYEFDCAVNVNKPVHHKCIYCIVANTKLLLFLTFSNRHWPIHSRSSITSSQPFLSWNLSWN